MELFSLGKTAHLRPRPKSVAQRQQGHAAEYQCQINMRNINEISELTFTGQQTVRFHARENHYRCIVCFESVDGEVQRRSEGATLCVCGPGESV